MSKLLSAALCSAAVLCVAGCATREPAAPLNGEVLMRDVRVLAADDMEGRRISTPGGEKARAYVEGRFRDAGLKPVQGGWTQAFETTVKARPGETLRGANVWGMIPGSDRSDRYIVVSAHYDHLGVRDGQIYNGADDDASGVAALLAIAERLSRTRPRHSILFVAYDGEEGGLLGARWFMAHPPAPLDSLLVNVNLDMVGRGDRGELYVTGTRVNPSLRSVVEAAAAGLPLKVLFGHEDPADKANDWTNQSDHWVFAEKSKPFLYFGVEDHPDYHKPTDDADKIPTPFFGAAATVILRTVQGLDRSL
jgi:Zn-dependent M28 family amino/carboxypeptidase